MLKQFFRSIEDPKRRLLGRNIWMMRNIGIILPGNKIYKTIFIVINGIAVIFVITEYVELYFFRNDVDEVLTNLKISFLSVVCTVKTNTCVLWQKKWVELIDYVTEADKEETDDMDSIRATIVESYTRKCRKITNFYWILIVITFITTVMTPFLKYLSAIYIDHEDVAELRMDHIFSTWMPFDKYSSQGYWITAVWHTSMCLYGALTMAGFDAVAGVIMVFLGAKLDLLRERCAVMLGNKGRPLSEDEAGKMFQKMHRTHVLLVKYSRMFNSLLSPVMFLYVVLCSVVLCASAYELTSATTFVQKVLRAQYLTFAIAQLFMYCWHSNDVLYKSERVMLGTYESEWWAASIKQQRSILLLAGQLNKKILFTAGPFTDLTLNTFITILKGAYSYYTLVRQ